MTRPLVFAAALAFASPAVAQEEAQPAEPIGVPGAGLDLAGEVALLSDYRFRGVSRSDEDPALQAALTATHGSGLYAGLRATTLKGLDGFRLRDPAFRDLGDLQLDLYAGYSARLGGGFEADAGAVYYVFAGGQGETDYVEPYASLSYLIGPLYATAGLKYAPVQRAIGGEDMLYGFAQVDVSVPFRPWRFKALVGRQDWGRFGSYWTWSAGVEHQLQVEGLPDLDVGLSYVDTSSPAPGADAGLVATVRLAF